VFLLSQFSLNARQFTGAVADAGDVHTDLIQHRNEEVRQRSIVRVNDVPSTLKNVLPSRENGG
jgi:hypothetical protein